MVPKGEKERNNVSNKCLPPAAKGMDIVLVQPEADAIGFQTQTKKSKENKEIGILDVACPGQGMWQQQPGHLIETRPSGHRSDAGTGDVADDREYSCGDGRARRAGRALAGRQGWGKGCSHAQGEAPTVPGIAQTER